MSFINSEIQLKSKKVIVNTKEKRRDHHISGVFTTAATG